MSKVRVILDEEVDELIEVLMIAGDQFATIGDRDTAGRCRRLAREIRDQRDGQIEIESRTQDQVRTDTVEKPLDPQEIVDVAGPDSLPPAPIRDVLVTPQPEPVALPRLMPTPPAVEVQTGGWPRNADGVTRFMVQAGIGDIAWLYQKIHGLAQRWGSPVELVVAGDLPHRAREFVEMLPGVSFGGYGEFTSDDVVASMMEKPLPLTVDEMRGLTLPLSVNGHIERGGRIESWYPEIETLDKLTLKTTDDHRARAAEILARETPARRPGRRPKVARPPRPIIGIYAASLAASRAWGFWDAAEWAEIATGIRKDVECDFVMIGAEWDDEFSQDIVSKVDENIGSRIRRCMREPFGVTAEVLHGLDMLVAFPSGIPIVAPLIGTPTVWWLPDRELPGGGNAKNLTGWIPRSSLDQGLIETLPMTTPEDAARDVLKSRPFARIGQVRS